MNSLDLHRIERQFKHTLAVFVLCIIGTVTVISLSILRARNDAVDDVRRGSESITDVLSLSVAEKAEGLKLLLDSVLSELLVPDDPSLFKDFNSRADLSQSLQNKVRSLAGIETLAVLNHEGWSTATSTQFPAPNLNFADRVYFSEQLIAGNEAVPFFDQPVLSRVTGRWTIYVSRPIKTPSGRFSGIIMAGVQPTLFMDLKGLPEGIEDRSYVILRKDGTVIARFPELAADTPLKIASNNFQQAVAQGSNFYEANNALDGRSRYIFAKNVPNAPLVAMVTSSKPAALNQWARRALEAALGAFLALTCFIGLAYALRKQFHSLRRLAARFEDAINSMAQGLAMYDRDSRLLVCNRRWREMFRLSESDIPLGATRNEVKQKILEKGIYWGDKEIYLTHSSPPGKSKKRMNDGRVIATDVNEFAEGVVVTHSDVTEQEKAASEISYLALHDTLTGLPNRAKFQEHLKTNIRRDMDAKAVTAVLVLDLDRFKEVNDTLGHVVGDLLLTEVGLRLRGCVRSSDLLARLGGDEFAVVQCNVRSHGEIRALARRIIEMMDQPYMIEGYNIQVRASIGIASTRTSGQDTNAIMKHADLALYEAKARGRGRYCFFNKLMSEAASRRREIEEELRTAIGWNQLELHYQPIVTTSDHRIVGFEALLRWNHPGGAISPVEFIPLAEETGMIIPIGEWVIQEASQQLRLWPEDIFIAVNISPVQLRDQQLISVLCNALNGLLPHRMHIEITETTILDGSEGIRQTLNKIAELGIEISLDDFGTGYSSLTYLRKYPFKSIKVDRSFIAEICSPGPSATIVASVTELAHGLGMWVIAEGVETNCQLERVRSFGCEATQGYYFSRPLNAEGAGLLLQGDRLFVDRNDIVSDGN